ncbi:MAG: DUF6090 family protein [Ignavibacteriaceae bacterium]
MTRLFKNIRQKLAAENKAMAYLRYAIGEILLVVIGILIALQVNNWNENRKDTKFEHEILALIDQNLQQDSLALSSELSKTKLAIGLTDSLLKQVKLKNFNNDSLNYWMGKIICFERFRSQSSAYEMLKAKGLENISDKTLQMALISYYDQSLYIVYQSMKDVELSFNKDWTPLIKENFTDFKWRVYCQPANSKEIFEKPANITLFKLYQDNRRGLVRNGEKALDKITEIRDLIN